MPQKSYSSQMLEEVGGGRRRTGSHVIGQGFIEVIPHFWNCIDRTYCSRLCTHIDSLWMGGHTLREEMIADSSAVFTINHIDFKVDSYFTIL